MRSRFCEHVSVAEELVPLRVLRNFYNKHCPQAALPLQYLGNMALAMSFWYIRWRKTARSFSRAATWSLYDTFQCVIPIWYDSQSR